MNRKFALSILTLLTASANSHAVLSVTFRVGAATPVVVVASLSIASAVSTIL
jgi:hypothetical protein